MASPNGSIITNYGRSVLAVATPETPVTIVTLAVGDGNGDYPQLTANMTELVREVWRTTVIAGPLRDPNYPDHITFEAVIPDGDGPFTVREIAIFDDKDKMVAIGQVGAIDKPATGANYVMTLTVRLTIALDSEGQINLFSDGSYIIEHNGTTGRSLPDCHPIAAITGLQPTLDGKSPLGHTHVHADITNRDAPDSHPIAAITGLDTALAGKSPLGHTHVHADTTNRDAPDSHPIAAITGLQAAIDNSGTKDHQQLINRSVADTHPIAAITGLQPALDGKSPLGHTHVHADITSRDAPDSHPIAAITGLQGTLDGKSPAGHTHDHQTLSNRSAADCHPISAVSGLQAALDGNNVVGNYTSDGIVNAVFTHYYKAMVNGVLKTICDLAGTLSGAMPDRVNFGVYLSSGASVMLVNNDLSTPSTHLFTTTVDQTGFNWGYSGATKPFAISWRAIGIVD